MRGLLIIALLAAVTPCMSAQRMAASPHFTRSDHRGGNSRSFLEPLALYDPFYSDDLSSTGYQVESQPPVIVVQTAPAQAPSPERPSSPLMIELQGDRYVRLSGEGASGTQMLDPMADVPRRHDRPTAAAIPPAAGSDPTPAVLVFRDGHREEVSDYTITGGIIYIAGDPYTGGSWIRQVELSSLNLPETVNSNHSRGVTFQLPSAPNEVIVRP